MEIIMLLFGGWIQALAEGIFHFAILAFSAYAAWIAIKLIANWVIKYLDGTLPDE